MSMKIFGLLIVFLLGISILNLAARKISVIEKIGFAFPIGMGIGSLLMFFMDLLHIPLNNIYTILGIYLAIIIAINIFLFLKKNGIDFSPQKIIKSFKIVPINFAWLYLIATLCYVLYGLLSKTLFWPVCIYDSVNGYDFIAKAIEVEGTLNNSIFDQTDPLYTIRSVYPPLIPLNFGFAYIIGFETSKIIVALFFGSLGIAFYSLLKKYTTHLGAALFTLLLIITPEFAAFSCLSSPNPPCTFYASLGILSLYIWYDKDESAYFWVGSILLILALWTRSETIMFAASGGILVLLKSIKQKKIFPVIFYGVSCFIVFAIWQIYLKFVLEADQAQPIIKYLYWDPGKFSRMWAKITMITFSTQFYGVVIYLFLITLLINIKNIIVEKDRIVLIVCIMAAWCLYVFVLYQFDIDYTRSSMGGLIESGYKRGLFYFLPVILFYAATNKLSSTLFFKYLTIESTPKS